MPTCSDRERLIVEYNEAVQKLSESVNRLKACNGDGHGFAEAHRATEKARLHAENTRMMLELHRAEHGC